MTTAHYKRLGDYIHQIKKKNSENKYTELLGINIDKFFMPSVANVIGTDLTRYKVVNPNQFACNRMHVGRDYRLPIALSKNDKPFLVSPAYDVFEIKDESVLNPDYLMMWFSREEFDRNSWFYTDTDVRGKLGWDSFCDMRLPIPSIEKQNEIVKEYNTVVNRITLNEQLNQKLEETAQALYKHWFVDFNFPITKEGCPELVSKSPELEGKPYKASGGEMVYNEELDKEIPVGWEVQGLSFIADYLNGAAMQKYPANTNSLKQSTPVLKIRELNLGVTDEKSDEASMDIPEKYKIYNGDIIFSWSGTLTIDIWTGGYAGLNQHLFKVSSANFPRWYYYLATKYYVNEFIRIAEGNKTSMGHIKREHLDNALVSFPKEGLNIINSSLESLLKKIETKKLKNNKLLDIKNLLLSKMTKVEVGKINNG